MSSTSSVSAGEFEFDDSQNRVIGDLARKMSLVGLVMIFFGVLQMVNGVSSLVMSRNPDRMIEAAEKAGYVAEQIEMLKKDFADGSWASPLVGFLDRVCPGRFVPAPGRRVDTPGGRRICRRCPHEGKRHFPADGRDPGAPSQVHGDLLTSFWSRR